MAYDIIETVPGHVNITCKVSGRPYTRSNKLGMFCDATNCECEQGSQGFGVLVDNLMATPSNSPDEFIKNFMKIFGDII